MLIVVPWGDFQNHAHWRIVRWMPFARPPLKTTDIIGNLLLYVPFGWGAATLFERRGRGARWKTVVLAVVLSAFTEWTQIFSHFRFPSMTDVTCNAIGAWLGAVARRR